MFHKNHRKTGFTLIELLVVIAIITILAAVLMPALMKAWNRGAYGSFTQQKNAIMGDVNCAAYFTFEEGPGIAAPYTTSNLAYAYSPNPGSGFIPDPPGDATLIPNTFGSDWNVNNSRFHGLKYGLQFNGSSDYVDCTNNQRFDITGPYLTVEAWIKPYSLGGVVVSKSGSSDNYYLSINAGGQIVFYAGSIFTTSAGTPPVTASKWNHIVGTYDANLNVRNVYCNGDLIASPAPVVVLATSDGALEIGQRNSSSYFEGVIDEVAIYNIALSPEEIRRHYQSGNR